MCVTCDIDRHLVARFDLFRRENYACGDCSNSTKDYCLPHAIKHGQFPPRVFLGPRLDGVGAFGLFGIRPVEAFSIASVDAIPGAYDSELAKHTWMPALATAISTGSIREIVYIGQVGTPAAEVLADHSTEEHPILADWYKEHRAVIKLAKRLFGHDTKPEVRLANIERAIPVYAVRQLRSFIYTDFPDSKIKVHAGLYNPNTRDIEWVDDADAGTYTQQGPEELQKRFESQRHLLHTPAEHNEDDGRFFAGCMDSRAIPSHVLSPDNETAVSSSMGGIWPQHDTRLGKLTLMAELAMLIERRNLKEFTFMGHTGCAGAKLAASKPTTDPLREPWQHTFKNMLMPVANTLYGPVHTPETILDAVEKAIPVYTQRNVQDFCDRFYPEKKITVMSYLYQMQSGNLSVVTDANKGEYKQLTNYPALNPDNLPPVCPRTKKAMTCA